MMKDKIKKTIKENRSLFSEEEIDDYFLEGTKSTSLFYFIAGFMANPKNNKWKSITKEFPSCDNGYVDRLVLVRVKNKNKSDGIYLYDVSSFDGESWCKRIHTWEDILDWKPIN